MWPGKRGASLIELLVAFSVIAVAAALALPFLGSSKRLGLAAAVQDLMGDLRRARADATTRGVHYRVELSGTSYSVQRLEDEDGDGLWSPNGPARQVDLPQGVSISAGAGEVIEFDTRGLLTPDPDGTPPGVITIRVEDENSSKEIQVWPSGQVQPV